MIADVPEYVWVPVVAVLWALAKLIEAWCRILAADKVAGAAVVAADKVAVATSKQDVKLDLIHGLVNSQHGAALKALAVALRTTANRDPTAHNTAAADVAERASRDHEDRQAAIDERGKPDAG
jgi:hypothetical protein